MPRKKRETLVHFDLDALSKETAKKSTDFDSKESIGVCLKKTREAKKLTLEDVSKHLKIKEIYLEALEEGHYYTFPGLAYGVGFLKTYATYLGLDTQRLLEAFYQETASIKKEPLDMPIPENHNVLPSKKTLLIISVFLLIAYFVWFMLFSLNYDNQTEFRIPQEVTKEKQLIDSTSVQKLNKESTQELNKETDGAGNIRIVEGFYSPDEEDKAWQEGDHLSGDAGDQMKKDFVPVTKTPAKIYGEKERFRVSLKAGEEVWLEVKRNDRLLLSKVLYKGDTYNAPKFSDDLVIKTGNAGALEVFIDGKSYGKLGKKGAVRSNISLNPTILKEHLF